MERIKSLLKMTRHTRMKVATILYFAQVSDTNAELVRLGNQVALLEEEKGNLQLSLVDFDELKGRNQDKRSTAGVIVDLVMLPGFQSVFLFRYSPFSIFSPFPLS